MLPALLMLLTLSSVASALERYYLKKSEVFCDSQQTLCLRGSITYEPNLRLLSLNARVQKHPGPGELRLSFSGTNRQAVPRRTEIVIQIRGNHSEIIDRRSRPDAPDVENWRLTGFLFTPQG